MSAALLKQMCTNKIVHSSAKVGTLLLALGLTSACLKRNQSGTASALRMIPKNHFGFDVGRTLQKRLIFHGHRDPWRSNPKDKPAEDVVNREIIQQVKDTLAWAEDPSKATMAQLEGAYAKTNYGRALYSLITPGGYLNTEYLTAIEVPEGTEFIKDLSRTAGVHAESDDMIRRFPLWFNTFMMVRSAAVVNTETIRVFPLGALRDAARAYDGDKIPSFTKPASFNDSMTQVFSAENLSLFQVWDLTFNGEQWSTSPEVGSERDGRALLLGLSSYQSLMLRALGLKVDPDRRKAATDLVYLREIVKAAGHGVPATAPVTADYDLKGSYVLSFVPKNTKEMPLGDVIASMVKKINAADPTVMPNLYSHFDAFEAFMKGASDNQKAWNSLDGLESETDEKDVRSHDVKAADGTETNTIDADSKPIMPDAEGATNKDDSSAPDSKNGDTTNRGAGDSIGGNGQNGVESIEDGRRGAR